MIIGMGGLVCFFSLRSSDYDEQVDISTTNCTYSSHIGRRIFFHTCLKENKTVYDIRYFWLDDDDILQASIIDVKVSLEEFSKICNYCFDHHVLFSSVTLKNEK